MTPLELIIVASLWTLGGATFITEGILMKRNPCLDGFKFIEEILWESLAPSTRMCAAMCARRDSCLTFTFDGSTCRGYSLPVTSASSSSTSFTGARTFLRDGAVESYELAIQNPTGYSYDNPVQFPANVNISAMSRLCFSVKVCTDAHLLLTPDPQSTSLKLYEIVIGGWANTKSVIRTAKQQSNPKASKIHIPLSCNQFRRFYVSWERAGLVEVGSRQPGSTQGCLDDEPFLSYTNPQPFSINYVFLSGYGSNAPSWKMYGCLE